jgi:uncharacterized protein YqfB (UPF0267 family)
MEQLSWKHKLRMEMMGVFIKLNIHHLASIDMEYLNQFHKESEQRKTKKVKEWLKNPIPASEALKQQFEIHKEIARTYQIHTTNNSFADGVK